MPSFPTILFDELQPFALLRRHLRQQTPHHGIPAFVHRLGAETVKLDAFFIAELGGHLSEAHDGPFARRRIPPQFSASIHAFGDVDDFINLHKWFVREGKNNNIAMIRVAIGGLFGVLAVRDLGNRQGSLEKPGTFK